MRTYRKRTPPIRLLVEGERSDVTEPTPNIQGTPESPHEATSPIAKPSIFKRILKIIGRTIIILLILLGSLGVFTQTKYFRAIVADKLTSLVSDETNGILTIERIDGNFFTGFTLHNVQLKLKGSFDTNPIIRVGEVFTRYSIIDLITSKDLPITSVILRSPDIHLVKLQGDSTWNYEKLFKPSAPKTTIDTSHFRMTIDLANFRIEGGRLIARDFNTKATVASTKYAPLPAINYADIYLDSLDVDMRGYISGELKQRVRINNISFVEKRSSFRLHHLEATFDRNDEITSIEGLHIATDRSAIKISASVNPLVMLGGKPYDSLGSSNAKLHLEADAVSTSELRQFIPDLSILGGTPGLMLDAEGTYGDLKITRGKLILRGSSSASFTGMIKNLHKPDDIAFNMDLQGRDLSDSSLKSYIPGIPVSDLSRFGIINIPHLHFEGTPLTFKTNFDIKTTNGDLVGNGMLDMRPKQPTYTMDVTSTNLNVGRLVGDTTYRSNTNIKLHVKGKGFDLKTAQAEFSLASSAPFRFWKFDFTGLSTSGTLSGGIFNVNNTSIKFADGSSIISDYMIVDFNGKETRYEVSVNANRIPIAHYLSQFPDSTKIDLSATLQGAGTSLDALEGSVEAEIDGLEYRGQPIDSVTFSALFSRLEDGRRADHINSSIADISLHGNYTLDRLVESITSRIDAVLNDLSRKADGIKESHLTEDLKKGKLPDSLEMAFTVNMKDLRALDVFTPTLTLLGEGRIRGFLQKHSDGSMDVDATGNISQFLFRTRNAPDPKAKDSTAPSNLSLRIYDTVRFSVEATHLTNNPRSALDSLRAVIALFSDSTIRFNTTTISHPNVSVIYDEGTLSYALSGALPDLLKVVVRGRGDFTASSYHFPLDSLMLDFGNDFQWYSERPPTITFDSTGRISMDTLSLYHPELGYDPGRSLAQRLKCGFELQGDSIHYAFFEAPLLKVKDIPLFITNGKRTSDLSSFNGRVTNLRVSASGAMANPVFNASLLIRNFIYNNVTLDSCKADLLYKNYTLTGIADLHVDTAAFLIESARAGKKILRLPPDNGFHIAIDSVPLLLHLAENADSKRAANGFGNRRQSIHVSGKAFPLDVFSDFLPVVKDAHGAISTELLVEGTADSIQLSGKAKVRDGSFLIPTTNIYYDFDGALSLAGSKMSFDEFNVRNQSSDDPDGRASATGYVLFDGFNVKNFNFKVKTDRLTVLTNSSKESLKIVYGPLAISTGARSIELGGSMDAPTLSGDVTIPQAYLTLPQNTSSTSIEQSRDIVFRIVNLGENDTTGSQIIDTAKFDSLITESIYDIEDRDPIIRKQEVKQGIATKDPKAALIKKGSASDDLSFQDKLLYDVSLNMPGNTFINIYFNRGIALTGEALFAEIRSVGDFSIKRNNPGDQLLFVGTLQLTNQSSYKFLREFSPVTGTLEFFNDVANPTLNLRAEYIGTSNSSGQDEQIKIVLIIRGTPNEPELTMELYRKNSSFGAFEKENKPQDEVNTDVLVFLSTGKLPSGLSNAEKLNVAASLNSVLPSFASSYFNNLIGTLSLQRYIRNISFESGSSIASSKVKLTAGLGDVTFRVGTGKLNEQPLAGEYTVEVPLSQFFNFSLARNVIFQFQASNYDLETLKAALIAPPTFVGTVEFRIPLP